MNKSFLFFLSPSFRIGIASNIRKSEKTMHDNMKSEWQTSKANRVDDRFHKLFPFASKGCDFFHENSFLLWEKWENNNDERCARCTPQPISLHFLSPSMRYLIEKCFQSLNSFVALKGKCTVSIYGVARGTLTVWLDVLFGAAQRSTRHTLPNILNVMHIAVILIIIIRLVFFFYFISVVAVQIIHTFLIAKLREVCRPRAVRMQTNRHSMQFLPRTQWKFICYFR